MVFGPGGGAAMIFGIVYIVFSIWHYKKYKNHSNWVIRNLWWLYLAITYIYNHYLADKLNLNLGFLGYYESSVVPAIILYLIWFISKRGK
jgi:hypothetical protein